MLDHCAVGNRIDVGCLLYKTVEQLTPVSRCLVIEPKHELIQIIGQMLVTDSPADASPSAVVSAVMTPGGPGSEGKT